MVMDVASVPGNAISLTPVKGAKIDPEGILDDCGAVAVIEGIFVVADRCAAEVPESGSAVVNSPTVCCSVTGSCAIETNVGVCDGMIPVGTTVLASNVVMSIGVKPVEWQAKSVRLYTLPPSGSSSTLYSVHKEMLVWNTAAVQKIPVSIHSRTHSVALDTDVTTRMYFTLMLLPS
jgi:hypothetical protein